MALLAILVAALAAPAASASCRGRHWVTTWEAPPGDGLGGLSGSLGEEAVPGGGQYDKAELGGGTFRIVLTPHRGGSVVRIHVSNRFGSQPVSFATATIATVHGPAHPVTFNHARNVTISAGADAVSDRVVLRFKAFANLAVSLYAPTPLTSITEHLTGRQTSFFAPLALGDLTAGGSFPYRTTTRTFLDAVDVRASRRVGTVVAFGDSITDGYGGTPSGTASNPLGATENPIGVDSPTRWPDLLASRLRSARRPLTVANAAISGNRILRDGADGAAPIYTVFGPAGLTRFRADALGQAGVSDVIVLEGINDLGQSPAASAAQVIAGLENLVKQIHAAHLRVQLGTLTPVGGNGYEAIEAARQQVNAWIRGQHRAGVIDFDAAVRDPRQPTRLLAADDSGDHLHPSPTGYRDMADAVRLSRLRTPCG